MIPLQPKKKGAAKKGGKKGGKIDPWPKVSCFVRGVHKSESIFFDVKSRRTLFQSNRIPT